jgi:hypothetical protein
MSSRVTGLVFFGLAILCLFIDAWIGVIGSGSADLSSLQFVAGCGIFFFAVIGTVFLGHSVNLGARLKAFPWKKTWLVLAAIAALIILFDMAVRFLPEPKRIVEQIWWEKGVVMVNQLDQTNGFDPSKPFKIWNADGSSWLVPSGKFVPSVKNPTPLPEQTAP